MAVRHVKYKYKYYKGLAMKLNIFEDFTSNDIIYKDEHGYIKGKLKPDGYWWIDKFYVYPEFRGKGFARDLASHIPQKAKLLAQPLKVKGEDTLDRDPLIKFYRSLGFQERPDKYDNMIMIRESSNTNDINALYQLASSEVDGLKVGSEIHNLSSIAASLDDYSILKGIRKINTDALGGPSSVFYAKNDFDRSRALAEQIKQSKEIYPLILVHDSEGLYILEGAHRYVALCYLGVKHFPALIVVDNS